MRRPGWYRVALVLASVPALAQQQIADPDFDTSVANPAYPRGGPTVVIDEAHNNFHTADGRYKPFADLLRGDGYIVVAGTRAFTPGALADADVLVIANANSPAGSDPGSPAFTEPECDVVRDWVRGGGALLLVADHAPFGGAAENLGARFAVTMGKGWAFDGSPEADGLSSQFVFSRENGLLGHHPLVDGRDLSEGVTRVRTFTGQSLGVPDGAVALLTLAATTRESGDMEVLNAADAALRESNAPDAASAFGTSVGGRAQGLALTVGAGRVVILGEAAMLSAQVVRLPDSDGDGEREFRMGMNVAGYDNRQFALNVLHWLSGALN